MQNFRPGTIVAVTFAAAALVLTVWPPAASADHYPWVPIGFTSTLNNGITSGGAYSNRVFVTTEEGFHYYDIASQQWTSRDEPGWIGRSCRALAQFPLHPQRVITGRVNAFFKGYIEVSEDLGQTGQVVYQSNGGAVTDIDGFGDPWHLYACTWSDVAPGELVRSIDGGLSWTLVPGHQQYAMTDVAVLSANEIYVAGDAQVTRSLDGGASWESLRANLPANLGLYCLLAPPPVTSLPGGMSRFDGRSGDGLTSFQSSAPGPASPARDDAIEAVFLMVSNDAGLYVSASSDITWQQVLPDACRAVVYRFVQLDVFVYWDEIVAVTFDGRVLFCRNFSWQWEDWTTGIAPETPIDIVVCDDSYYVLTQEGNVYRSEGSDTTGLPEFPGMAATLDLGAAPNPFNPSTSLHFTAPVAGSARLSVYDLAGREVALLLDAWIPEGFRQVTWQPRDLASGVYVARLSVGATVASRRLVLVK